MTIRIDRTTDEVGQETWRATLRLRPKAGEVHFDEVREAMTDSELQTTAALHRMAGTKGAEFYEPPIVSLRGVTGGMLVTATARVVPRDWPWVV